MITKSIFKQKIEYSQVKSLMNIQYGADDNNGLKEISFICLTDDFIGKATYNFKRQIQGGLPCICLYFITA